MNVFASGRSADSDDPSGLRFARIGHWTSLPAGSLGALQHEACVCRWVPFNMKPVVRSAAKASARVASSATVAFESARRGDAFARFATREHAACLDGALKYRSSDATVSPRSLVADADPTAAAARRRLPMMESPDAAKPASVSAAALHAASPRHLCVHAQASCCMALRRVVWRRLTGVPASVLVDAAASGRWR